MNLNPQKIFKRIWLNCKGVMKTLYENSMKIIKKIINNKSYSDRVKTGTELKK